MVATVAQSYLFALFIFLLHGLEGGKQTTSTRVLVDMRSTGEKERERDSSFLPPLKHDSRMTVRES